jgi:transcriptional regulatory protein LevR
LGGYYKKRWEENNIDDGGDHIQHGVKLLLTYYFKVIVSGLSCDNDLNSFKVPTKIVTTSSTSFNEKVGSLFNNNQNAYLVMGMWKAKLALVEKWISFLKVLNIACYTCIRRLVSSLLRSFQRLTKRRNC